MKKMIAIALVLMLCVSALSVSAFAADTFTVTVEMDSATTPYAWAWGDYGNAFSSWPGVTMTKDGNVWKIDVPMGTTGFIVNNGSGTQTADIAIPGTGDVTIKVSADYSSFEVDGYVAPAPNGYYVTGEGNIFGNWAECNEAGKMTESNGIYVKEFTGVPAGEHKLKVNVGSWSESWGGNGADGNYEFNVAEDNSTVTVKYDPATYTVSVEVNGAPTDGEVVPPVDYDAYYVTGSTEWLGNWAECNENGLMTEEDGVYVKTFENVTAGTVELKVNVGNWSADWGYNGNNFKFEVAEGDNVTVTFNPANQTVSVAVNGVNVNPITGDVSLAGVGIALLAATAGLVALVGKKKEF